MNVSLGSAQFGLRYGITNKSGRTSKKEIEKIIGIAKTNNIQYIDTEINYGISEQVLGEIGVNDFKIISKIPPIPENICNIELWVENSIFSSLKRLNKNNLEGLLLHNPEELNSSSGEKLSRTCKLH